MEPHLFSAPAFELHQHHLGTRLTTWQIVVGSSNASSPLAHACLWVTSISTGVVVLHFRLNEKCAAWNLNAVGVQRHPARWNVSQKAFDSSISWETWKQRQITQTNKESEHLGAVVVVVEEEEEVSSTLADRDEPPPSTIFNPTKIPGCCQATGPPHHHHRTVYFSYKGNFLILFHYSAQNYGKNLGGRLKKEIEKGLFLLGFNIVAGGGGRQGDYLITTVCARDCLNVTPITDPTTFSHRKTP